jgi:hypothetical protein
MTWAQRGSTIGLSTVFVALCLLIAAEISRDGQSGAPYPPVEARGAAGARPGPANPTATPDRHAAWLADILGRPLFSPTRRPADTGVSGLPRLTGIVVAGSQRVAIFAGPANGHPIIAQAGAHVGAYEVQTIADEGVTVVGPEGTTLIKPIFDVARPSVTAPPPVPAAPAVPPARPQPPRPGTK